MRFENIDDVTRNTQNPQDLMLYFSYIASIYLQPEQFAYLWTIIEKVFYLKRQELPVTGCYRAFLAFVSGCNNEKLVQAFVELFNRSHSRVRLRSRHDNGISSVYVESHGSFADRFLSPTWRACESFEEPRHPSSTTQLRRKSASETTNRERPFDQLVANEDIRAAESRYRKSSQPNNSTELGVELSSSRVPVDENRSPLSTLDLGPNLDGATLDYNATTGTVIVMTAPGNYLDLLCDEFGSHTSDDLHEADDLGQSDSLVSELDIVESESVISEAARDFTDSLEPNEESEPEEEQSAEFGPAGNPEEPEMTQPDTIEQPLSRSNVDDSSSTPGPQDQTEMKKLNSIQDKSPSSRVEFVAVEFQEVVHTLAPAPFNLVNRPEPPQSLSENFRLSQNDSQYLMTPVPPAVAPDNVLPQIRRFAVDEQEDQEANCDCPTPNTDAHRLHVETCNRICDQLICISNHRFTQEIANGASSRLGQDPAEFMSQISTPSGSVDLGRVVAAAELTATHFETNPGARAQQLAVVTQRLGERAFDQFRAIMDNLTGRLTELASPTFFIEVFLQLTGAVQIIDDPLAEIVASFVNSCLVRSDSLNP